MNNRKQNHSHSIINRPPKPMWLKGFSVIDRGLYRRSYRQKHTSFASAEDGAVCGRATFLTTSSIREKDTKLTRPKPTNAKEVVPG